MKHIFLWPRAMYCYLSLELQQVRHTQVNVATSLTHGCPLTSCEAMRHDVGDAHTQSSTLTRRDHPWSAAIQALLPLKTKLNGTSHTTTLQQLKTKIQSSYGRGRGTLPPVMEMPAMSQTFILSAPVMKHCLKCRKISEYRKYSAPDFCEELTAPSTDGEGAHPFWMHRPMIPHFVT